MKLKSRLKTKNEKADILAYNPGYITINGTESDFNNLPVKPEPVTDETGAVTNQAEIDAFNSAGHRVWQDQSGTVNIQIVYDVDRQFMFINGNLMRFYDIDDNGDISESELSTIVINYNKTEEDRREYHLSKLKAIKEDSEK